MSHNTFEWGVALLAICMITASGSATAKAAVITDGTEQQAPLMGDVNLDGDVDIYQIDGTGDCYILSNNLGTTTGAKWTDGDLNGDGDVDAWQPDDSGDAQILFEHLPADGTGTAEAIYDPTTGELFFKASAHRMIFGIGSDVIYSDDLDPLFRRPVWQNDGATLAFPHFSGYTFELDSVGLVLPAGLAQEDMTFSYTFAGFPTVHAPVTMLPVPEPSTIAMTLVTLGFLGVFWRRRRA